MGMAKIKVLARNFFSEWGARRRGRAQVDKSLGRALSDSSHGKVASGGPGDAHAKVVAKGHKSYAKSFKK
jgi:hypothetical protein